MPVSKPRKKATKKPAKKAAPKAGKTMMPRDAGADLERPSKVTTTGPETPADGRQDDPAASRRNALDRLEDPDLDNGLATLAALAASGDALIRTAAGAVAWGHDVRQDKVASFRGLCLMFVRMCFNLDPLYPDAITAWNESPGKHRVTDASKIPRGHAVCWQGGDHGHIALATGNGLCLTNDTGRPGTINVARINDISEAWSYRLLGFLTDLNGETAPRAKPSKPDRLSNREWRIRTLRRAIVNARANGHSARARRLRDWLSDLRR